MRQTALLEKQPPYSESEIEELHDGLLELRGEVSGESGALLARFRFLLSTEPGREYLTHGVCRRLFMMMRCLERVYEIFPPERCELLGRDERLDVEIALHAFVTNLVGALDNLAWIVAHEKRLVPPTRKEEVGLFNPRFQLQLPNRLRNYVQSDEIKAWMTTYAKDYRDALAHRIPLYVAPSRLTDLEAETYRALESEIEEASRSGDFRKVSELQDRQSEIGSICELMIHSFSDESAKPIRFHAQMIADLRTILEMAKLLREDLSAA